MQLWSNGEVHVVGTGRGLARIEGKTTAITRFDPERRNRLEEPPPLRWLAAVGDDGTRVLFARGEAGKSDVSCATFEGGRGETRLVDAPQIRAAIGLEGDRLLVCTAQREGKRMRAVVAGGRYADGKLVLDEPITLPDAPRITFPTGLFDKGVDLWPEDDEDQDPEDPFDPTSLDVVIEEGFEGEVRLSRTQHGIAVTGSYAGIVAVLDEKTLRPKFALRVPSQSSPDIHAIATAAGVLVVLVIEGRNSAILHIAPDGKVLAQRGKFGRESAWAVSPPVLVDDTHVLVTQRFKESTPYLLELGDLAPTKVKSGLETGASMVAVGSSRGGDAHLLAFALDVAPANSPD